MIVGTQFNLADVGPPCKPVSNQIYLVTFMCLTVDTSFIFTKKNQNLENVFLIHISNAEIAKCRQKLVTKLF